MFLDLDHFKPVNDVHGHAAGDVVLNEVARRLAQGARDEDTVCRNGGDEFLYLLMNPQGRRNADRIAAAVIENLARSIRVGQQQLTVRPSIGIAIYPDGGGHGATLIRHADAAMYRAKKLDCGYAVHEAQAGNDQSHSDGAGEGASLAPPIGCVRPSYPDSLVHMPMQPAHSAAKPRLMLAASFANASAAVGVSRPSARAAATSVWYWPSAWMARSSCWRRDALPAAWL